MKSILKVTICLAFMLMIVSLAEAQKVPKAIKAQIQKDCGGSAKVSSVRIGPSKNGFFGDCDDYSTNVYEKRGDGIRKIFEGTYGMNGGMGFTKKVYNGYYEISMGGSAGPYLTIEETYRYKGNKYVRYKCEECNLENPNKPRCGPC